MAFNKENKVTTKELAPSLIELLNRKANAVDLNTHINDATRHITAEERKKWNEVQDNAKAYTDTKLGEALGPITNILGNTSGSKNLATLLDEKLDKTVFDSFKSTLHRVATSGSYNDLIDKPAGVSYSDTANSALKADTATRADTATKAINADHATRADSAGTADNVKGITFYIQGSYPTGAAEGTFFFHTGELMFYVWANGKWNMTGAALR